MKMRSHLQKKPSPSPIQLFGIAQMRTTLTLIPLYSKGIMEASCAALHWSCAEWLPPAVRRHSQCSTAEAKHKHAMVLVISAWESVSSCLGRGQVAGTVRTEWLGSETDACLSFDLENTLHFTVLIRGTTVSSASLVNLLSLRVYAWWNYLSCNEYQFKLLMQTFACLNAWFLIVSMQKHLFVLFLCSTKYQSAFSLELGFLGPQ